MFTIFRRAPFEHVPPRRAAETEHAREVHLEDRVPVLVAVLVRRAAAG